MDSVKDGQRLKIGAERNRIEGSSRSAAIADAPAGGASSARESRALKDPIGLAAETVMNSETLSAPEALSKAPPKDFVEYDSGPYTWRVAAQFADWFQQSTTEWFRLSDVSGATLVKRNSQRDVWRVVIPEGGFFVKVYHPVGLLARAKLLIRGPIASQEWHVGRYAAAHGIATVAPVAMAWQQDRRITGRSVLITEEVAGAKPLNEYWIGIRKDRVAADRLLDALARLIARAHQCGFQHGDMHPGNLLVRSDGARHEVFFVDLHRVHTGRSVMPRQVVANLAQLNQWFRRNATRTQRLRFLHNYICYRDQFAQASPLARNWRINLRKLAADLAVQAERHARRLWAKRDRRSMRTSKYFAKIRPADGWRGHALLLTKHPASSGFGEVIRIDRRQWENWLQDPLAWADPTRHTLLKDSHTATICRARMTTADTTLEVVVKRHLARNAWKKLVQTFGPSRNMRSWRMANKLRNRELPAAIPLAVVQRFALGIFRQDSISITEFVDGAVDLESFLTRGVADLPAEMQRRIKDRLIDSVVRLLKAFHERGFVHRDLKAPNLMIRWEPPYDAEPVLTFIDMDGISHRLRSTEPQRIRAIVRLCASLLSSPGCTASDRLRFLKTYLTGPGRTSSDWKRYWRRIYDEVCTKLHDKEERRQWKLVHYGRE